MLFVASKTETGLPDESGYESSRILYEFPLLRNVKDRIACVHRNPHFSLWIETRLDSRQILTSENDVTGQFSISPSIPSLKFSLFYSRLRPRNL
jgi:hypothetical protein